ncbi:C69 family dipeptidase [Azotobacter chroococcum]
MAADPLLAEAGIEEAVIPTLLLPQALSARHGVELLGHYIERYGASEACGAILADAFEAWYLETGSAHHWIAVRIPADSYLVAAGAMRVHDVDLDGAGVLHSRGLFEFVAEHRLLADPDRRRFDFAGAFGVPGSPHDAERIWLTQKHLSSSQRQGPRQPRYPLFLKPDGRLCVTDVMTVLRGTSMWRVFEGGTGRPSAHDRTEASHIVCLNADMPTELRGLIWQTLGSPLGTPTCRSTMRCRTSPANWAAVPTRRAEPPPTGPSAASLRWPAAKRPGISPHCRPCGMPKSRSSSSSSTT